LITAQSALVLSQLDYCNSLPDSTSPLSSWLKMLQHGSSIDTSLIHWSAYTQYTGYMFKSDSLSELPSWHIEHCMAHRCLHGGVTVYLCRWYANSIKTQISHGWSAHCAILPSVSNWM